METLAKLKKGFEHLAADESSKNEAIVNLEEWLTDERLADYRPYIEHLITEGNYSALLDSFWRMIPFGTGGRRGSVGAGPNRINQYTMSLSVQGHCDYLRQVVGLNGEQKVVVAYDVRRFDDQRGVYRGVDGLLSGLTSRDMARVSAMTYAANGVVAYIIGPLEDEIDAPACTDRYISTPELSFLVRELKASGGLNISASHNHPDDNGGKFYNSDGGQEIPPNDEALLKAVQQVLQVKTMPYAEARAKGLIRFVPVELHKRYIELNTALCPTDSRSARVAFSPLCGTGNTTVLEALIELEFEVFEVPEQSAYDGSFSSVRYRIGNPEVPESMDKLAEVALGKGCDIGLATDPDADRLGIIVPDGKSGYKPVNGNEIGILLLESIIETKKRDGTLPKRPIFITTAVTSRLQSKIAKLHGCQVVSDLMVGFKYMGDALKHLEQSGRFPPGGRSKGVDYIEGKLEDFVFTCEESHGYLLAPEIRDKDACGAAVHLAGLASRLKDEGRTVLGMLRDIYRVYGYFCNRVRSLVMEGIVGLERIRMIQERLRENPPEEIAQMEVVRFVDYQKVGGPLKSATDEASRNVLLFELKDSQGADVRLVVRPSGTEPKTKIYVEVPSRSILSGTLADATPEDLAKVSNDELDRIIAATDRQADQIGNDFIRYCLGPQVLGDVYQTLPFESLLVSDLVPVERKIRFCAEILPELLKRLSGGVAEEDIGSWLEAELAQFGEDALGLVGPAATAWIDRMGTEGRFGPEVLNAARGMLNRLG